MQQQNNIVGLIPARKHSKGLPGKNRLSVHGKSLLQYAIEPLTKLNLSSFIVSTDDEKLYNEGIASGALDIGLRPHHLAQDETLLVEVLRFEIERLKTYNVFPSYLLVPQLTSPGLTSKIALDLIEKCLSTNADVGFTYCRSPVLEASRLLQLRSDDDLEYLFPTISYKRRQELDSTIVSRCGLVYVLRVQFIESCEKNIYQGECCGIEVPEHLSTTIDTLDDFLKFSNLANFTSTTTETNGN